MWVYVYKFTKKRMLAKCKTRLVVWEDQQKLISADTYADIYAVTLVICFFCIFMIMTVRFDLKLIQYDAVNVFVHANLNEIVFMKMSDEYWKTDHILKLNKTLYELWRSSFLWQQKLKKILLNQKFKEILHEFCCMTWNDILIFFYVDDIMFAHRRKDKTLVQ